MHLRVSSSPNRPAVGGEAMVGSLAGFNGFIGLGAKPEQIVSCLRRCAGGPNDGAIILAQDLEPGADIVGVAHRWQDAERRADEGAGYFGNQLLMGILLGPEAAGEITTEFCA